MNSVVTGQTPAAKEKKIFYLTKVLYRDFQVVRETITESKADYFVTVFIPELLEKNKIKNESSFINSLSRLVSCGVLESGSLEDVEYAKNGDPRKSYKKYTLTPNIIVLPRHKG